MFLTLGSVNMGPPATVVAVYRFLLSPRWLALSLFVIALMVIGIRAGFWQMDKHDARVDRNAVIREHFGDDAIPLDSVVPRGATVDSLQEWTLVTVTGRYAPDDEITVKFMVRDSKPGVDVLTPLLLADGTAVVVDRGWLSTQNTGQRPDDIPPPPPGEVTVEGWLRVNNGAGPQAVEPIDGQVRAISSVGLATAVPFELRNGYLNLRSQSPEATDELRLEPEPDLGQGPHFFYALQWWFFGLLAMVGWAWFARIEARENQASETRSA